MKENVNQALETLRELSLYSGETYPRHRRTHRRYWIVTEAKAVFQTPGGAVTLMGARYLMSRREVCEYAAARLAGRMPALEWQKDLPPFQWPQDRDRVMTLLADG